METKSLTLQDSLEILLKRKWMIATIFLIASGSAAFYSLQVTPIYEASTTLLLESVRQEQSLLSNLYLLRQGNPIETEIEMIRSRTLAERVVRALNLNFKILESPPHFRGSFQNLSISPEVPYGQYGLTIVDDSGGFILKTNDGRPLGEGRSGEPFSQGGLSFNLNYPNAQIGDSITFSVENPLHEARGLQGATTVQRTRAPNIIRISLQSDNPARAAWMANELAKQFVEENLAFARGEARSAKEFIEEQVELARENLQEAEREIQIYKEKEKFVMLDEDVKRKITTLALFETQKEEMVMKQREATKRLQSLRNQLSGKGSYAQYRSLASIPTVSSNPLVRNLKNRLSVLEVQRAQMLQKYTEAYPEVIEINSQILEIKRGMNEAIQQMLLISPSSGDPIYGNIISGIISNEVEAGALEERIQALTGVIDKYNKELETLPEKEVYLARLTRKTQVGESIYTMLLTKLEEARISEAMRIGNIRIIDPAIPPDYHIRPRKKQNTMMGGFLGLLVGLGLAFFLEFLDTSIKDSEEIERILQLPVLGVIPHIRRSRQILPIRKGEEEDGLEKRLITHLSPKSAVAEAYRTLRTNLQFARAGNSCETLVITSPFPGEGKSITSANIAITMAQMGSKTLLVSSDLRKPVLHKLFKQEKTLGLTEILVGKASLANAVLPTEIENLYLLNTGPLPPNPAELLGSKEMKQLIEEMKTTFDVTLFDSPPVLAVTDAALLGGRMDGVILIVQSETTDRRAAKEAKKLLDTAKVKCLGTILNNVHQKRPYGKYGSRYHYRYYYDEEGDDGERKGRSWKAFVLTIKHFIRKRIRFKSQETR